MVTKNTVHQKRSALSREALWNKHLGPSLSPSCFLLIWSYLLRYPRQLGRQLNKVVYLMCTVHHDFQSSIRIIEPSNEAFQPKIVHLKKNKVEKVDVIALFLKKRRKNLESAKTFWGKKDPLLELISCVWKKISRSLSGQGAFFHLTQALASSDLQSLPL